MGGFLQHGDSEIAKIIPFAYQILPSTEHPSSEFFERRLPNNISSGVEISLETADR